MKNQALHNFNNLLNMIVSSFKQFLEEGRKEHPFKIVDKKYCAKKQKDVLVIKLVGKNIITEKTAEEIVMDDAWLSGFSPTDVRAITFLACNEVNKPQSKIVAVEYSALEQDMRLHIKNIDSDCVEIKTSSEISKCKTMLTGFGKEDIYRIGYFYGIKSNSINENLNHQG